MKKTGADYFAERHVDAAFPNAPCRELELKGKSDPVRARVIVVGDDFSSVQSL